MYQQLRNKEIKGLVMGGRLLVATLGPPFKSAPTVRSQKIPVRPPFSTQAVYAVGCD